MKYYLHDSNSFNDEKVTLLYMKFGYEAVGLFYVILEKLSQQEKPIPEMVLKSQLNIKKRLEKMLNFMYEIDILSVKNGEVFSETLLNFSEKYKIKKEKTRKKVAQWRSKQSDKKSVTGYVPVSNPRKVKLSKVKLSKVKEIIKEKLLFYSNEIKKIEEKESLKEKYVAFVSYLFGENALGCPVEHILKLKTQLKFIEYKKLFKKAHSKNLAIADLLDSWLNKPSYSKDVVSVYLTLNNWINMNKGKNLEPVVEKNWGNKKRSNETESLLEIINNKLRN